MHSDRLRAPTPVGSSVWTRAKAASTSARGTRRSSDSSRKDKIARLVQLIDQEAGDETDAAGLLPRQT
jgi:hypothetical protein